ncbi:DUF6576 domain-containing protein [Chryseobacterium sp. POL2]|uniref:DUF6576 domain-containing protein n=1 Tax=Chryseobacterium sp. POL2 TaxID=2713414 RepID=UPI001E422C61|nr:DUF6576 domain-containing protein [Chryseobacterium sp. POL2]
MTIVSIILIIIVIFAFVFRKKITSTVSSQEEKYISIDDRFNERKREREKEIDQLLSKMGKNGIDDLSSKDRKRLEELSKN